VVGVRVVKVGSKETQNVAPSYAVVVLPQDMPKVVPVVLVVPVVPVVLDKLDVRVGMVDTTMKMENIFLVSQGQILLHCQITRAGQTVVPVQMVMLAKQ
jgi:hypothetical protein